MIIAAADGSSLSNPGPAGWAWYVDEDRWAAGGWAHGTNNMGELMAVLDLLRQTHGEELRVLCDSQYAINCCTKWIPGWKRRWWRKADEHARAAATAYRDGLLVPHGPGFVAGSAPAVSLAVGPTKREPEPDLFSVTELLATSGHWPAPEDDAE